MYNIGLYDDINTLKPIDLFSSLSGSIFKIERLV